MTKLLAWTTITLFAAAIVSASATIWVGFSGPLVVAGVLSVVLAVVADAVRMELNERVCAAEHAARLASMDRG